jgi:hypothetical protein
MMRDLLAADSTGQPAQTDRLFQFLQRADFKTYEVSQVFRRIQDLDFRIARRRKWASFGGKILARQSITTVRLLRNVWVAFNQMSLLYMRRTFTK